MKYKRLVYVYVSSGAGPEKVSVNKLSQEPFVPLFKQEGFYYLFNRFIQESLFQEILVVMESGRSPGIITFDFPGITGVCVSNLSDLTPFMRADDLLWARGGWKSWCNFLSWWGSAHREILFYRANTGTGRWPFWPVLLEDTSPDIATIEVAPTPEIPFAHRRLIYPFNKPIDPTIFFPDAGTPVYDLCIGASHIHDKKNQFSIIPVLLAYRKKYGKDLKCVLPGALHRGVNTNDLWPSIQRHSLDITLPGMLPRQILAKEVYNRSRLYIHTAVGGQNDRGPLEALACGTSVMTYKYHNSPPFFKEIIPFVDLDNPETASEKIYISLEAEKKVDKKTVADSFTHFNGIENVIIPQFKKLIEML